MSLQKINEIHKHGAGAEFVILNTATSQGALDQTSEKNS